MAYTITESKGLIMRTIKMKSFILCIPKSSNIHTSMKKVWEQSSAIKHGGNRAKKFSACTVTFIWYDEGCRKRI